MLTAARTIPLVILRLIYLFQAHGSVDSTWVSFNLSLLTILHTNISVIAACISFFKPIIDSLAPGFIGNDLHFSLDSNEAQNVRTHNWNGVGVPRRDTALPRVLESIRRDTDTDSQGSVDKSHTVRSPRDRWELRDSANFRLQKATHTTHPQDS